VKVRWSPLAIRRASEIVDFISLDQPLAARRWAEGIFKVVRQLERFPARGRMVPEIRRPAIRELIYGEYRVIYNYKIQSSIIGILTVRHGRRRLDRRELRADR
jgi:plasmid stabilization system protein ParE